MKRKLPSGARKASRASHSLSNDRDWVPNFPDKTVHTNHVPDFVKAHSTKIENDKLQAEKLILWIDKYSPRSLVDLAVHSKKVAEVQAWMEGHIQVTSTLSSGDFVLLLTGPAGVGKSAVVHILARMLKLDICEWCAPTPTLWKEHSHHLNSGAPYVSKLQEFKIFLDSARKYHSLPVVSQEKHGSSPSICVESKRLKLLLLDDLPQIHSRESLLDLCHCLYSFVKSVRFPTVVIITECVESADTGEGMGRMVVKLQEALEKAGAVKISFNPITANSIKRVLTRISTAEKYSIDSDVISLIARSCGGDIRHAICSMQFFCLGQYSIESPWDLGGPNSAQPKLKRSKISKTGGNVGFCSDPPFLESPMDQKERNVTLAFRDGILSLFHALGKLLYNKRHTDKELDSGSHLNFMLVEEFRRHPLNMAVPETILSQAYTETSIIASFLHENFLDFIDNEAPDDVAVAMSYLSDADYLLGRRSKRPRRSPQLGFLNIDEIDPDNLNAVAGSIATRGVLFANTHPAPRRWLSLRAPAIHQVESSLRKRKVEFYTRMWTNDMWNLTIVNSATQAMEYEPYLQKMGYNISPLSSYLFHMDKRVKVDLEADHLEVCEAENELTSTLLKEQQHLAGIHRSMEVTLRTDTSLDGAQMDVEDDIEEW